MVVERNVLGFSLYPEEFNKEFNTHIFTWRDCVKNMGLDIKRHVFLD